MIRKATLDDLSFIHHITAKYRKFGYIADAPSAELIEYINDSTMDLVIWEQNQTPAGFALFCQIGDTAGSLELRRLGLDVTDTGLGQPFIRALIDHAFDTIEAKRIWLDVILANTRAQAAYKRAGFMHEGTLRQSWRCPTGEIVDMQLFGMLLNERP